MAIPTNDLTWKNVNGVHTMQVETALFTVLFEICWAGGDLTTGGYHIFVNKKPLPQFFARVEVAQTWAIDAVIKDLGRLDASLEEALHLLES